MKQITWQEVDEITATLRYRGAFSFICQGVQFTRLIKLDQHLDIAAACVRDSESIFPAVNVEFYLT